MKARFAITALVALLILCAGYAALLIARDEATMHAVQRIFYFHVASWNAMFCAFFVACYASVAYLVTGKRKWDALGVSGVEVGVMCCTIGLITGPIWVPWDSKHVSTFILWLLFIAYLLLRGLVEDPEKKASLSAVFAIFASLDIPLVYLANRLWRTQHPQPVIAGGQGSGLDPVMSKVLLLCLFAIFCVMILVLVDRYRLELLRNEAAELKFEIESRGLDAAEGATTPALQKGGL